MKKQVLNFVVVGNFLRMCFALLMVGIITFSINACSNKNKLIGEWKYQDDNQSWSYTFFDNGIYSFRNSYTMWSDKYTISDNVLFLEESGRIYTFTFEIDGDRLIWNGPKGEDILVKVK